MVRFGGIAMIVSFLICMFFNPELVKTSQTIGLMVISFLILLFGILDDVRDFSWKVQIVFQGLLVVLLVFFEYSVDYLVSPFGQALYFGGLEFTFFQLSFSVISVAIIFFWTLSVINAINWADGIDGLSGGIGLVGALSLFFISLTSQVNQPAIAIVAIIFMGSILGFWWLNFPKAKIEAGTSGSYFIGFFLAATAIIAGTKIATAIIVLAIPLVDLIWVVVQRFMNKAPITKKDFGHLHHKLRYLGWSNAKIVSLYLVFIATMFFVVSAVNSRVEKFAIIGLEIVLIVIFLFSTSLKNRKINHIIK
ncbi:MAG: MraY family glycosyltransferase [Patescibacteria group bacterium]|nr:MraY family glycosyltransferase [Patescibacteria group bacterium]